MLQKRILQESLAKMIASLGCSAAVVGGLSSSVRADIIVGYGPENSAEAVAPLDSLAGVTGLPLTRGEGLNAGSGNTYNSSGWTDEPTDYIQWGWSASQPMNLTDLDLRYDRSASGPSIVDIQLSVNDGQFQSVFTDNDVNASGEDVLDVDLTSFTGVTAATFRLYGMTASSAGGTFDIEALTGLDPSRGIVVSGTAAAVPEPSSFQMAGLALVGLGLTRAWRRR